MATSKTPRRKAKKSRSGTKGIKKSPARPKKKATVSKRQPTRSLERGFEEFGEELEGSFKRLEEHGKEWEAKAKSCWYRTFGPIGPFVESLIGLFFVFIGILVLEFMNTVLHTAFIANLSFFLHSHLPIFFVLFMFFNYAKYMRMVAPKTYYLIKPLTIALGLTVGLWFIAWGLRIVNISVDISIFESISSWILTNLAGLFIAFAVLAYVIMIIIRSQEVSVVKEKKISKPKKTKGKVIYSGGRLYRSGSERILGGVCGGLGEYLGIDPVLIRLGWVVFSLFYGAGILAYLIAWIIIPRNPKDK